MQGVASSNHTIDEQRRSGWAFVVDMAGFDSDMVARWTQELLWNIDRPDVAFYIVVSSSPLGSQGAPIADERLTYVEAGNDIGAVERISLALQLVDVPRCFVSSTPVSLGPDDLRAVEAALDYSDLVEVGLKTRGAGADEASAYYSSRSVQFSVRFDLYCHLRGLDLRIRTSRDALTDLARRVRGWGGSVGTVALGDARAFAPKFIFNDRRGQSFDFTRATALFVNLPRWKYRPFAAKPSVQIVRLGAKALTVDNDAFDGLNAQSMDGYEVVDLPCAEGDELPTLREYLKGVGDSLIAPVGIQFRVPPWRLLEQIQQIKSGVTCCAGRVAVGDAAVLHTYDTEGWASVPENLDVTQLSTLFGPGRALYELLTDGPSRALRLVHSRHFVAASGETDRTDLDGRAASVLDPVHQASVGPYVPGWKSTTLLVFEQYTVGKIDYIDAYDRIAGIVAHVSCDGQLLRELAAVTSPKQEDIDTLGALGLPFALQAAVNIEEPANLLVQRAVTRASKEELFMEEGVAPKSGRCSDLHKGHLFVKHAVGEESWFALVGASSSKQSR